MENSKVINPFGPAISGSDSVTEGRLHQECFLWAWNTHPETRMRLCYNLGNSKNRIDGNINKGKGLIAGRADFTFYWNKTAFFIEIKTETGKQAPAQKEFQKIVESAGYKYFIARSLNEFKTIINGIKQSKQNDIQKIGETIRKQCREHMTINGLRFDGMSWAEISRILEKYGFKDEIPF